MNSLHLSEEACGDLVLKYSFIIWNIYGIYTDQIVTQWDSLLEINHVRQTRTYRKDSRLDKMKQNKMIKAGMSLCRGSAKSRVWEASDQHCLLHKN